MRPGCQCFCVGTSLPDEQPAQFAPLKILPSWKNFVIKFTFLPFILNCLRRQIEFLSRVFSMSSGRDLPLILEKGTWRKGPALSSVEGARWWWRRWWWHEWRGVPGADRCCTGGCRLHIVHEDQSLITHSNGPLIHKGNRSPPPPPQYYCCQVWSLFCC